MLLTERALHTFHSLRTARASTSSLPQQALVLIQFGRYTYTGGCDAIVRVWRTDLGADQDPPIAIDAPESITSLAAAVRAPVTRVPPCLLTGSLKSDCWLSGSEDSEVRRYPKGATDLDGLVTSAAGVAIRCVAVDPKGKRLAVASEYAHIYPVRFLRRSAHI